MSNRRSTQDSSNGRDHHLYKRGETYWCRYVLGGSERRVSLRTTDVQKARKARDKLISGVNDARAGRAPEVIYIWNDAVEEFLRFQSMQVKAGSVAMGTAIRYETSVRQLSEMLANEPLSSITTATVLDFIEARRAEDRSSSTIKNDLTAWSKVMAHAALRKMIEVNPLRQVDRKIWVGTDADAIMPPSDPEVAAMIKEVRAWSEDMADLMIWLRETGMRLAEALHFCAEDVNPDRITATLSRGVKRNKSSGLKTRQIALGRAASLLHSMPTKGRVFSRLSLDSAVVSTRYGQWRRQRQGREDRAAESAGRKPEIRPTFRLHDLRHTFAIASLVDAPDSVYRLQQQLGHGSPNTTMGYVRFMEREGGKRRHLRDRTLFGSLTDCQAT
jgi:integrase